MCFVLPHAWHLEQRALIEAWLNNNLCLFCCGGPGADGTRDSQRKLMNVWQRLSTFHKPANQYISRRLGCCPVLLSWSSLSSALQFAVIFTELIHQVKASAWVLLGLWSLVFENWNGGMISSFAFVKCEIVTLCQAEWDLNGGWVTPFKMICFPTLFQKSSCAQLCEIKVSSYF